MNGEIGLLVVVVAVVAVNLFAPVCLLCTVYMVIDVCTTYLGTVFFLLCFRTIEYPEGSYSELKRFKSRILSR
jgi:hypothetical protein